MRVLYFGDPRAGLGLLSAKELGVELCGIVHGRSGGEGARKLSSALKTSPSLPRWRLPNLDDPEIQEALALTQPELIVSSFYPRRIPEAVLKLAPGVNVHPSALPKWRGPDPAFWVIYHREDKTAITIHRLSPALDEGHILMAETIDVRRRESGGALAVRLERRAASFMVSYVIDSAQLHRSDPQKWRDHLQGEPQEGESSWAPLVDPDELEIDWSMTATQVEAFVRAAAPEPCAYSGLGHELMVIHHGRVGVFDRPLQSAEDQVIPVGQAFLDEGRCFIRCGEGFYQLDDVSIGRRRLRGERLAALLGATIAPR